MWKPREQAIKIAWGGRSLTMYEWEKILPLSQGCIYARWRRGLPPHEILGLPAKDVLDRLDTSEIVGVVLTRRQYLAEIRRRNRLRGRCLDEAQTMF